MKKTHILMSLRIQSASVVVIKLLEKQHCLRKLYRINHAENYLKIQISKSVGFK